MITVNFSNKIRYNFRIMLIKFKSFIAKNGNSKDSKDEDDGKEDADEPINGKSLGEIAIIDKFITQTKVDGLQTLYTVICPSNIAICFSCVR